MLNMETNSETLREYERVVGLNEDVLRFLNIRIEEVEEGPSIIMQSKNERPSRSPRESGREDDRMEVSKSVAASSSVDGDIESSEG